MYLRRDFSRNGSLYEKQPTSAFTIISPPTNQSGPMFVWNRETDNKKNQNTNLQIKKKLKLMLQTMIPIIIVDFEQRWVSFF